MIQNSPDPHRRVDVLGVGVSAVNLARAVDIIAKWVEARQRQYVCVTGVHGVMESQRDADLREVHNRSGLTTPDGMPLSWLLRASGQRDVGRVCGADLMMAVSGVSARRGWRQYYYGGADGVADLLVARLLSRFPNLPIAGTHCPPFAPLPSLPDPKVVELINGARPDIVWVGLSTPKQERWMALYRELLDAPVLIGVGAAFDFHAGLRRRAPGWMQASGLEWLFRLMQEPRRLGPRYLVNNPLFLWRLATRATPPQPDFLAPSAERSESSETLDAAPLT